MDMSRENNSLHIHDVPIKSILLLSISISHSETSLPFITPTKRRNFLWNYGHSLEKELRRANFRLIKYSRKDETENREVIKASML